MPPGAGQDQWEDVTPGPVINAGASRAQKSGDDEWEDVGPSQKKDFAPGSYQKKPGGEILNAGTPAPATPLERFSEITTGTRHPIDDTVAALRNWRDKPVENLGQLAGDTARVLPNMARSVLYHPVETVKAVTGGNQFAEDIENKRYGAAAADVAGGTANVLGPVALGGPEAMEATGDASARAISRAGETMQPVKDSIGRMTREPGVIEMQPDGTGRFVKAGPLKPAVKLGSRIVGAGTGATAGNIGLGPYGAAGGAVAGWRLGPDVADLILPEHPNPVGPYSPLPKRMSIPEPELPGTGAPLPDAGEFYENKAEDLMKRGKEQETLDRKAKADALREAKSKIVIAGENAPTPRNTGSEGRPATWTNEKVYELASKGNRDAITQIGERQLEMPPNARYIMGDIDVARAVSNPREIARFNPDGTPIRNVDNPTAQRPSSRARIQIVGSEPPPETPNPQTPIDFGALPTPGRSLPQVEQPVAVGTAKSSTPIPTAEDLEEAFRSKGRSGVDSFNLAKQTIQEATSGEVPESVRTQALERIKRVMGPDTRAAGEPLAVGKNEPLAPGTEVLHHFPNPEHGTEAVVAKTSQGYSAVLRDTDSGNTLPQARIFKTEQEAIDYGKSLAKGTSPKYGKPVELGKPTEPAKPLNGKQVQLAKMEDRPAPERTARTRAPIEKLENFDEDTLANAKAELEEANGKWQTFERPGRYVHDVNFEPGDLTHKPDVQAYGVPSARPDLEAAHPWLKNLPKMTAGKLQAAIESGKGVEYTRLLNEAGRHVQAAKLRNGPIIEEYGDRLEEAAKSAESVDPDLARTLRDIKAGKFSALGNLRTYVERTLKDADSAAAFDKALGELSQEELRESTPEPSGRGDQPREANQQAVKLGPPVLPGMEQAVEENKASAAVELGKKLTQKINEPRSIESAAGEMESKSPLFRGTGASPQNEMFAPGGAAKPQEIVEAAGGIYGGKGATGHEITLPLSMTKDLPIRESMKPFVSITIPEGKLTVENVKAAIAAKLSKMRGK